MHSGKLFLTGPQIEEWRGCPEEGRPQKPQPHRLTLVVSGGEGGSCRWEGSRRARRPAGPSSLWSDLCCCGHLPLRMRPRGLPVRSRGAQLGLSAQCTLERQRLTPMWGLSSECGQPLPGPLLCGPGHALSLWATLSSPVKWESLPLGVDVKTVRLVCEKQASRGSLGLQPALFSGLASCLWHRFGF